LESPGPLLTSATPVTTLDLSITGQDATINMWTDNAITNTIGAFVLAGLSTLLY